MSDTFGCINNTIKLRSGVYFDLADPKPDQFTLRDIAGALSKICRFGAQIDDWYSVAEHSVQCARVAMNDNEPNNTCLAVLMHDAAEAFIGDMVKPLKIMLPEYSVIESRIEKVIAEKFGIDFDGNKDVIRAIDHGMLMAERFALFGPDGYEWGGQYEARMIRIRPRCWTPFEAEEQFIEMATITLGLKP